MLWAIYCLDRADTEQTRNELRTIHRAHLDTAMSHLFFSGPLYNDDASIQIGSLFILSVEDRATAEKFITDEPFNMAGVFASVVIRRMGSGRFNPHLAGMEPSPRSQG